MHDNKIHEEPPKEVIPFLTDSDTGDEQPEQPEKIQTIYDEYFVLGDCMGC